MYYVYRNGRACLLQSGDRERAVDHCRGLPFPAAVIDGLGREVFRNAAPAETAKGLPYRCAICGGQFKHRGGADEPRNYQCEQCGDTPHSPEQGAAWKVKGRVAT